MSPIRSLNQRAYYAAEGPKKETINDFWGAVIRLNVTLITMTTGLWENKKEKCAQYWPEKVNELMVVQLNERESATIVMTKKEPFRSPLKGFVQTFSIETAAGKREVVHLQVDGWLDKHPYGPENLWELVQLTDQYEAAHPGASIYHCSGGIGRTGTLLTCKLIEQRLWQIVTSGIAMHRIGFDLSAGIAALRQQRPGMVNTVEQAKEIIQFFMMAPSMWGEKKLK
jgi:protein tyrosine phosphatase